MKRCGGIIFIIATLSLFFSHIYGQSVADPLLDKLIEKGIIESYEAQEVRNGISKVLKAQFDEEKKKEEEQKKQDKYKLKTSGYLQIMYTLDESTRPADHPGKYRDPIYIRRARVSFRQQITDWIGFNITPEFGRSAEPYETTSVITSTSPVRSTSVVSRVPYIDFKGAYIDLTFHDFVNFRIGQFNQPFGFENVFSSARKIFPNDSVQFMRDVLPSDYDVGIQYSFNYKKMLSLQVAALNGTTHQRETNNKKDISAKFAFEPRMFFEFLKGIELSFSYYDRYLGEIVTTTVTPRNGQHYNSYLKFERELFIPIFLTLEYVWGKNAALTHDVKSLVATLEIKPFEKILPLLKGLSPSFRYESWDPNINTSNNELEVYTFGLNYYPHKSVRFLLDYRMPKEKPSEITNNRLNFMAQVSF
ncbi:MAG: porin [Elusimicrobiota bacterium]|nr:porin [Elusimicrobiota bacterium]